MRPARLIFIISAILVTSACSSLGGSEKSAAITEAAPSPEAQERIAALEVEVSRLKSDNARLVATLLEKTRENEKLARNATEENAPADLQAQQQTNGPRQVVELSPTLTPPPPIRESRSVGNAAAPQMDDTDVPVEEAPRLVQPTFASTEEVYESEANGEIETQSVLFGVHLASYRKVEEAREGWRKLQRDNPDELGLLEPRVVQVNIPEKGVFMRLIGGGFSSQGKAMALCQSLKKKSLYCSVSGFEGERLSLASNTQ
ncbi:MAG: SPOR domain-containing protein [Marinicaulis sp.]|nr:SPOR domain-containing protein [Marinicaulis sp.]